MSRMFYNYDNAIDNFVVPCKASSVLDSSFQTPNLALIYNLKGELLGIEAKHQNPVTLFFNITESTGQDLVEVLSQATIKFKLISQNHKVALEKAYPPGEIFNPNTYDLAIFLSALEVGSLKQESYKILLTLDFEDESFTLFDENDGLLIIR